MPILPVNDARLYYETYGASGSPVVLVHGSWTSLETWAPAAAELSKSFRVLAYDRRGHGRSERVEGQGSVREDVADLAALIERFAGGPAWVVGSSFGGSITLRLATEHPDLLLGASVHEPPLYGLLEDDPSMRASLEDVLGKHQAVADRIASGDHAGAAELFVETVALGPGGWARLPSRTRENFIRHAPTFLDEARDPEQLTLEAARLSSIRRPVLVTSGKSSPKIFEAVVSEILSRIPLAGSHVFLNAGHVPHATDPAGYACVVKDFIEENRDES